MGRFFIGEFGITKVLLDEPVEDGVGALDGGIGRGWNGFGNCIKAPELEGPPKRL